MEKYFDLVLELLELEDKENLKKTALQIKDHQEKGDNISFFHQYDFLFKAWLAFCNQEMSEEEFVQIGDVESQFKLYNENKKNAKEYFSALKNKDFPENVFVIDQDAWNFFLTEKEQEEILDNLASDSKKIYLV